MPVKLIDLQMTLGAHLILIALRGATFADLALEAKEELPLTRAQVNPEGQVDMERSRRAVRH